MFTIRNIGGICLLLAGSTWLWLTPEFVGRDVDTSGFLWSASRILDLVTIAAFSVATWGLFTGTTGGKLSRSARRSSGSSPSSRSGWRPRPEARRWAPPSGTPPSTS